MISTAEKDVDNLGLQEDTKTRLNVIFKNVNNRTGIVKGAERGRAFMVLTLSLPPCPSMRCLLCPPPLE